LAIQKITVSSQSGSHSISKSEADLNIVVGFGQDDLGLKESKRYIEKDNTCSFKKENLQANEEPRQYLSSLV
jgi:hypothetical protein